MKKHIILLTIIIFVVSCQTNKKEYVKELKANVKELNSLLFSFEQKCKDLMNNDFKNRIVFSNCTNTTNVLENHECVHSDLLNKMKKLNIEEVRFEKEFDNDCPKKTTFNKVYFKRKKTFFDPVVYFLFEYCGSKDKYESPTIYYKPIDDFWGVYIDSNSP